MTVAPNDFRRDKPKIWVGMNTLNQSRPSARNEQLSQALIDPDKIAFLALASIEGVGAESLASIAGSGQTFESVLSVEIQHEAIELLRRHGARIDSASWADWRSVRARAIARARHWADGFARDGTHVVFRHEDAFPKRLLDLSSPPYWLFVRGSLSALSVPSISVVGTRNPSEDGRWLTKYVGASLSIWNAATVSGLAVGVDQLAHEASIRAGVPTVAVLGSGILSDHAPGAGDLRGRIIEGGGAIATEYLPDEGHSAKNLVRRNRLQAALGRVLIPTEWNSRSGTAHTVRFATQLRRPIALLRLPDWDEGRVTPTMGCGLETGRMFTIPGEDEAFRSFVRDALAGPLGSA